MHACMQSRVHHVQVAVQTAGAKLAAGAGKQQHLALQALWCSCRVQQTSLYMLQDHMFALQGVNGGS